MPRRQRQTKEIKVWIIPDYISNELIDELFSSVRVIKLYHNKNNPLIKNECWIRGNDSTVYTTVSYGGEQIRAHRLSYEIFKGKRLLNYGCHHCDSPACINPDHIFDGSQKQNMWDARRKRRMFSVNLNFESRVDAAEKRLLRDARKVEPVEDMESIVDRFNRLVK